LGQFAIKNEQLRIACKNSQIILSNKTENEVIGIESFNENTYSDDIIWSLERLVQDTFYPFMDVYHSVKNIIRTPLNLEDSETAVKISKEFNILLSNALTCAIAIREKADEIHSIYSEFKNAELIEFMKSFNILISLPDSSEEMVFESNLEDLYQKALEKFKGSGVNLIDQFHG
jgi:hypothetical protein